MAQIEPADDAPAGGNASRAASVGAALAMTKPSMLQKQVCYLFSQSVRDCRDVIGALAEQQQPAGASAPGSADRRGA
ncbi:MAG: hypothetical protein VKM97_01660, partial [Cyanobacteriota bacterium]|nr:hypothetical protein [Cyanobacteriota bacterium]